MKMVKVYMNVYLYVLCMNLANVNDLDVAMDMTGDQVASASSVFPPTSPFHLSHMLALCSQVCVVFTFLMGWISQYLPRFDGARIQSAV